MNDGSDRSRGLGASDAPGHEKAERRRRSRRLGQGFIATKQELNVDEERCRALWHVRGLARPATGQGGGGVHLLHVDRGTFASRERE